MRTIIAGSRCICNFKILSDFMRNTPWPVTTVISGGATGVDALGEIWADQQKIPLEIVPADWKKSGRSAGPIRNSVMAKNADALVAIWDGSSKGTANMIKQALDNNLKLYIITLEPGLDYDD